MKNSRTQTLQIQISLVSSEAPKKQTIVNAGFRLSKSFKIKNNKLNELPAIILAELDPNNPLL